VTLTAHLRPAPRFRISGATILHPLHVCIEWTRTAIYVFYFVIQRSPSASALARYHSKCQNGFRIFGFNFPSCEKHQSLENVDLGTGDCCQRLRLSVCANNVLGWKIQKQLLQERNLLRLRSLIYLQSEPSLALN
jgi:hypothetical protein